jgi:uncharacterized membrane-anchored protein YhcB (DUF1043 family)
MEWLVPIVVAVIGGPLVVLIQKLREENTNQHAEARDLLNKVVFKVDKVDEKLDDHITWHLTKKRKPSETKKS